MEKYICLLYNIFNIKNVIVLLFFSLLLILNNENKKTPKISIFLPIYNAEHTLKRTIQSIQNQTLKDIEIIAINDYSNDNTLNILTEMAQKDDRIKIVNNDKNYGLLYSRAMGILNSNGEYLLNLDSDDQINEKDNLEYLYNKARELKVDIVAYDIFDVKRNITVKCNHYNEFLQQPNLFKSIFMKNKLKDFLIWNKIIKKEIYLKAYEDFKNEIYNLRWNFFEDDIWNIFVHRNAKTKICLEKVVYIYNFNNHSLMNKRYDLFQFKNIIYRHEMYKKIFNKKEEKGYLFEEYYFLFNRIKNQINDLLLINDINIKKQVIQIFNVYLSDYNCTKEMTNDINKILKLIKENIFEKICDFTLL